MRGFRDFCIGLSALASLVLLLNLTGLVQKITTLIDTAVLLRVFQ